MRLETMTQLLQAKIIMQNHIQKWTLSAQQWAFLQPSMRKWSHSAHCYCNNLQNSNGAEFEGKTFFAFPYESIALLKLVTVKAAGLYSDPE